MIDISQKPLAGKKGIVLGIANEHSIAYADCSRHGFLLATMSSTENLGCCVSNAAAYLMSMIVLMVRLTRSKAIEPVVDTAAIDARGGASGVSP